VACRVGLVADDCVSDHFLPPLDGRPEPSGSRAPCPVCGTRRAISIQVKNGRPVWNAHCDPSCDRDAIGKAIAAAVPCYRHPDRRSRKPAPDLDELHALLTDRSIPVNALRLGALEALGMSTAEAAEKLKLPRRTFYDAVRILAQSRRSRGVRILALVERANSANARTKPQVKGSLSLFERT
jgi:hypothetical protein